MVLHNNCVAIDTNVFLHLLNKSHNVDYHIHYLLAVLIQREASLLVDDQNLINEEHRKIMAHPSYDEEGFERGEAQILAYWLLDIDNSTEVAIGDDELKSIIGRIIASEQAAVDRALVYVAFAEGTALISNDKRHIHSRRDELLQETASVRGKTAAILTSQEAFAALSPPQ